MTGDGYLAGPIKQSDAIVTLIAVRSGDGVCQRLLLKTHQAAKEELLSKSVLQSIAKLASGYQRICDPQLWHYRFQLVPYGMTLEKSNVQQLLMKYIGCDKLGEHSLNSIKAFLGDCEGFYTIL